MKKLTCVSQFPLLVLTLFLTTMYTGCDSGTSSIPPPIIVNSLEDIIATPDGIVTLRSALKQAVSGQTISFEDSLDRGIISLTRIADEHTVLMGEVMGMRLEASGLVSYLVGYLDRDYGDSALYARKMLLLMHPILHQELL